MEEQPIAKRFIQKSRKFSKGRFIPRAPVLEEIKQEMNEDGSSADESSASSSDNSCNEFSEGEQEQLL